MSKRLSGRRVCSVCGAPYHISAYKETECAKCGGEVIQRQDDEPPNSKRRLKIYTLQTKPLIVYYAEKGLLVNIDGKLRSIDDVLKIVKY